MGVEEVADLTDRELLRRGCRMVTGVHEWFTNWTDRRSQTRKGF